VPTILFSSPRFIGPIIPDISIEEIEYSHAFVTVHPCELGTEISDHMVLRPKQITMRVAWSDSTRRPNQTGGTNGIIKVIYKALLALQARREPFNVSTGKKLYVNMVFESLVVTTDEKSEFILSCVAGLREVLITNTQLGEIIPNTQPNTQSDPAQTGSPNNPGQFQPIDQDLSNNQSILFTQNGGISNNVSPSLGSIPGVGFGGGLN
jgi:hypothetical protein